MKKAVVTGGAGFIGTHVVQALREEGFDVVVVDIKEGSDVRDTQKLQEIFKGAEFVFHLAALPRVQYSIAYGDTDTMPLHEGMAANPMSPYALQKYIGEQYCRLFSEVYELPTVSLRYFNVYGPGADPNGAYALVIAKFLQQRIERNPITITGDGTQTRDFAHVRDVVRANILAAKSSNVGKGEVINIGAGKNASVLKIAELIGGPVEHIAPRLEPHDTLADNALAKQLLGWEPTVTLEEGIAELKKLANLV